MSSVWTWWRIAGRWWVPAEMVLMGYYEHLFTGTCISGAAYFCRSEIHFRSCFPCLPGYTRPWLPSDRWIWLGMRSVMGNVIGWELRCSLGWIRLALMIGWWKIIEWLSWSTFTFKPRVTWLSNDVHTKRDFLLYTVNLRLNVFVFFNSSSDQVKKMTHYKKYSVAYWCKKVYFLCSF